MPSKSMKWWAGAKNSRWRHQAFSIVAFFLAFQVSSPSKSNIINVSLTNTAQSFFTFAARLENCAWACHCVFISFYLLHPMRSHCFSCISSNIPKASIVASKVLAKPRRHCQCAVTCKAVECADYICVGNGQLWYHMCRPNQAGNFSCVTSCEEELQPAILTPCSVLVTFMALLCVKDDCRSLVMDVFRDNAFC